MEDEPVDPGGQMVLLGGASEAEWASLLSAATRIRRAAGEVVWQAGEDGGALLLLFEGTVEVEARNGSQVAPIDAPAVLGVLEFFGVESRTATLTASRDTEGALLAPDDARALARDHPGLAASVLLDLGRLIALQLDGSLSALDEREEELRRLRAVVAESAPTRDDEDEPLAEEDEALDAVEPEPEPVEAEPDDAEAEPDDEPATEPDDAEAEPDDEPATEPDDEPATESDGEPATAPDDEPER